MSGSGTLRKAADLMQARAEAASPDPWHYRDDTVNPDGSGFSANVVEGMWDVASCYGGSTPPQEGRERQARADAAHIASWGPSPALTVAAGLRLAADNWNDETAVYFGERNMRLYPWLAVARAYLKGTP